MEWEIIDRDKRLLALLGCVIAGGFLLVAAILPLYRLNQSLYMQRTENEKQIVEISAQQKQLAQILSEKESMQEGLTEAVKNTFPMMKSYQLEGMLTEKIKQQGLTIIRVQLDMPEEPANVAAYGADAKEGSNPKGLDGIYLAKAEVSVAGQETNLDGFMEELSVTMPQIRLLSWENQERDFYILANIQMEIAMSRKE